MSSFLSSGLEWTRFKKGFPIRAYQLIAILSALVLPVTGLFTSGEGFTDPLWLRLVLGALFAAAFAMSCSAWAGDKAFFRSMWGLFYLEIGWASIIGAANQFEDGSGTTLLLVYSLAIAITWIGAQSIRPVVWMAGLGFVTAAVAVAMGQVSVGSYAPMIIGIATVGIVEIILVAAHFQARSEIRERKEIERELREAKQRAEEAAQLKSAMLANLSHEVRTPLTPIKGFAEVLEQKLSGEEKALAERIRSSGERLAETVNSVLQLSELEAGAADLDREQVDLRALVQKRVEQFTPEAEEKGVALVADLNGPVEGYWNETALQRTADNLIQNAVKFTPEGGRVTVRTRARGEEAILEIEDTGIGIKESAQEQIFEPFRQESEGWDREFEGTGLGLPIVQRLAGALGGGVDVQSQKGEGSRFLVRLPSDGSPTGVRQQ